MVLDHSLALKAGPLYEVTLSRILELARHPNLYAKVTFLPWGSAEQSPFGDMQDACKRVIEAYGPERCLWGSNFPTELWAPKATYAEHLRIFKQELGLTQAEQNAILAERQRVCGLNSFSLTISAGYCARQVPTKGGRTSGIVRITRASTTAC